MATLHDLSAAGQSVWLDYIRRDMLESGELAELVSGGIRGLTSNPTIFMKAIAGSELYDQQISLLDGEGAALFENLAIDDIRGAADVLNSVFTSSGGADGFVSLEVSPLLANDTEGTIGEARRLWDLVDRPNLMIKVPATPAGVPALEELIAANINVNATLMFSLDHYEVIANAYVRGVSRATRPAEVASVASFFVSRVDTNTDAALEKLGTEEAMALRGRAAVANAKLAYRRYQEIFEGADFSRQSERGARPQRVLWASTSTKNPEYRDVLYVEDLIGPNTVNTMPPNTIDAFLDHGRALPGSLEEDVDGAEEAIRAIGRVGIDFDALTEELQDEGVTAFADSFLELLSAIEEKSAALR